MHACICLSNCPFNICIDLLLMWPCQKNEEDFGNIIEQNYFHVCQLSSNNIVTCAQMYFIESPAKTLLPPYDYICFTFEVTVVSLCEQLDETLYLLFRLSDKVRFIKVLTIYCSCLYMSFLYLKITVIWCIQIDCFSNESIYNLGGQKWIQN